MSYSWACMLPPWMDIPTVYLSMIVAYRGRATRITIFLSVGSPSEAGASLDFTRFQFRSFTMCTRLFISLRRLKVADTWRAFVFEIFGYHQLLNVENRASFVTYKNIHIVWSLYISDTCLSWSPFQGSYTAVYKHWSFLPLKPRDVEKQLRGV